MKYHIVYMTINDINGNIYIGIHSTNKIDDGYLGSGFYLEKAFNKYGKHNFSRVILKYLESREEAFQLEKLIVTKDFVSRKDTYNKALGGNFGDLGFSLKGIPKPEGFSEKISQSHKNPSQARLNGYKITSSKTKGKPRSYAKTDEFRKVMKKVTAGSKNGMFGKKQPDSAKLILSMKAKTRIGSKSSRFKGWWVCGSYGKFGSQSEAEKFIGKSVVWYRCTQSKSSKWKDWYFEPKEK